MKKLLSILIVAAMLVSIFCVGLSAEVNVHTIGQHGVTNTVTDGVASIPEGGTASSAPVTLEIGQAENRYAVDVLFEDYVFTVAGLVWDVNALEYKPNGAANVFENKTINITVTNYSNAAITATGTITEPGAHNTAAGISLQMIDPNTSTETDGSVAVPVAAVTIGNGEGGATVATTGAFAASLKSENWTKSINTLIGNGVTDSYVVGKITVTITADAAAEAPQA